MFEDNRVYMTVFTLRAHVRTLTNPDGEVPLVPVTKGKTLCAAVVPWQLFDDCVKNNSRQRCKQA